MKDDTISRQAALTALNGCTEIFLNNLPPTIDRADAVDAIKALPSAQSGCEDAVYRKAVQMLLAYFVPEERYAEAVDGLRRLPPAQPGWIPCTPESKPKRCEYYLVTDDGYTEEAYLNCDGVWFSLDGNKLKDVTAWMEKPEPYKGGQDGPV